jgi:type 1 glutamine amidotransferase
MSNRVHCRVPQLAAAAALACAVAFPAVGSAAQPEAKAVPQPPIQTLLLTGHHNHNWRFTSRVHAETLEATGRFAVTIIEDPASTLATADAASRAALFVIDYNDLHEPKRWGDEAEANFVTRVREGAGVVVIHGANNAFKDWPDYAAMLGLVWREESGHGAFHAFDVRFTAPDHPIIAARGGLKRTFTHTDELYHRLVNPQRTPYTLLAAARSSPDHGGVNGDQPVAFITEFGQGRIFSTTLGHVWEREPKTKASVLGDDFRTLLARGAEWAATGRVTLPNTWRDERPANTLTDQEREDGWELLFDGKAAKLRGFKQKGWPKEGWTIKDGMIVHAAGVGGGDVVTMEQYGDFEFVVEWRAAPGGNSGIIYRCDEDHGYTWQTGREMQILDDERHQDGKKPKTSAGAMYDLFPATYDVVRPAGHWNHARVVARGTTIEHWLNGVRVVAIDTASDEYARAHAASKFPSMPDFGKPLRGHIALQDHGDLVEFRNIKVLRLDGMER